VLWVRLSSSNVHQSIMKPTVGIIHDILFSKFRTVPVIVHGLSHDCSWIVIVVIVGLVSTTYSNPKAASTSGRIRATTPFSSLLEERPPSDRLKLPKRAVVVARLEICDEADPSILLPFFLYYPPCQCRHGKVDIKLGTLGT
jgi:hypothetical protein